jgi:hypothetical protein
MMAEANFLKSLQEMDVDGISQRQTNAVKGKHFIILDDNYYKMFTFYSICLR